MGLEHLEDSVVKLESAVRESLLNAGSTPTDPDCQERFNDVVNQSLREVKQMVTNAKLVTFGVAVDPGNGLGPSAQPALRGTGRQDLALAGGLSSKYLRLL